MAFANSSDVVARWGREPSTEEVALINIRLGDVERMILRKIPDLEDKILDGTVDVADVIQVEADAVLRLVRNPDGYLSETDGDYTYQLQRELASGKLEIFPEEWQALGYNRFGMFVILPRINFAS